MAVLHQRPIRPQISARTSTTEPGDGSLLRRSPPPSRLPPRLSGRLPQRHNPSVAVCPSPRLPARSVATVPSASRTPPALLPLGTASRAVAESPRLLSAAPPSSRPRGYVLASTTGRWWFASSLHKLRSGRPLQVRAPRLPPLMPHSRPTSPRAPRPVARAPSLACPEGTRAPPPGGHGSLHLTPALAMARRAASTSPKPTARRSSFAAAPSPVRRRSPSPPLSPQGPRQKQARR